MPVVPVVPVVPVAATPFEALCSLPALQWICLVILLGMAAFYRTAFFLTLKVGTSHRVVPWPSMPACSCNVLTRSAHFC